MSSLFMQIKKWYETSGSKQRLMVILLAFSLLSTILLFLLTGTSGAADDPLGSTPLYFVSAFFKLIGVLLLIFVSSILFRRWSQVASGGKTTRQVRLLETIRLSPKQALHLISIGDRQFLIGATDQTVSLITQVENNLPVPPVETNTTQPVLDFGSLLQSFNLPRRSSK